MFAYGDLVQWFKDRCSDQVSRRNRAWDFGREHGLEPCEVAWNNVAVRWIDGVVYVVSRNVKRNGELGERYTVVTAEQWLDMHRVPGDESCVAMIGISISLPAVAMTCSAAIFSAVSAMAWLETSSLTS